MTRPRLVTGARLRYDEVREEHLLLIPEGAVRLNPTAAQVLELCDGADLLIHDAQYWPSEWDDKRTWGHCTVDYAVRVANESGARRLALFHHDPSHADDEVDRLLRHARQLAGCGLEEVVAAAEELTISFD